MKKIKISQLPLYSSLKGLFTIGTDANNNSVKVSLAFVEQETTNAVNNAKTATTAANTAAKSANEAKAAADKATKAANDATAKATTSAEKADTAAGKADKSAAAADIATQNATKATQEAKTATADADKATEAANNATEEANTATEAAKEATTNILAAFGGLIPTGMTVVCIERITDGNLADNRINAVLTPAGTLKNVIYISDNKAVTVAPDGRIQVVARGRSTVHVIPTCNTALAKTIQIEVTAPTLRVVTRTSLRFTQSGVFRLN